MLKKINRIRKFGVFDDFSWHDDLPEFKLFNVLYGWNYSGKTTLSRVFQCHETGKIHPDYAGSSFEFEDNEGNKYSSVSFPNGMSVRVFNSDFINDNLRWNEGLQPILLLGQENIQLQTELGENSTKLEELTAEVDRLTQLKIGQEQLLASSLTTRAGEIKYENSIVLFDKRHFEPLVVKAFEQVNRNLLSEGVVERLRLILSSTEKKSEISQLSLSSLSMNDIVKRVNDILEATVKAKIIEKLKNNALLNKWVKEGIDLHKGQQQCEFCGNNLPAGLLDIFNNHFSEDYNKLLSEITQAIRDISNLKLRSTFPDSANFYVEFQPEYVEKRKALEDEIVEINKTIENILTALEEKKTKAFEPLKTITLENRTNSIESLVKDVNIVISKNNLKTKEYDKQKSDALKELLDNFALEFVINHNYGQILDDIKNAQVEIGKNNIEKGKVSAAIREIEKQLSETVKGAATINEYLARYFGKDDIQIGVTADNKFQPRRKDKIAKNLSEGEKTAIALAYFITRLNDKNTTMANTIVYIDDPISSLDSNHLFNTYSFIRDIFYKYDNDANPKHTCNCAQLFISTHNFEFLNLIKDWFKKVKDMYVGRYLVSRMVNTTMDSTTLLELSSYLTKYKSEYSYLFSIIHSFKNNPNANFEQLYNLPNILRRFIESFTAFKYLSTANIEESIDKLIPNAVDCERVRKFVHYHTHSLTTNKLEQFSDLGECLKVVEIITSALEAIDPIHYAALQAENVIPVEA
jgi:wobble nucleotide-excising tRNase